MQDWKGLIKTELDALMVIEATRSGKMLLTTTRLKDHERTKVGSGAMYVYNDRGNIKRWTDGKLWGPSRILGKFLLYRELESKVKNNQWTKGQTRTMIVGGKVSVTSSRGTLVFQDGGLFKKTLSAKIDNVIWHLVSYYTQADLDYLRLNVPSLLPDFMMLQLPGAEFLTHSKKDKELVVKPQEVDQEISEIVTRFPQSYLARNQGQQYQSPISSFTPGEDISGQYFPALQDPGPYMNFPNKDLSIQQQYAEVKPEQRCLSTLDCINPYFLPMQPSMNEFHDDEFGLLPISSQDSDGLHQNSLENHAHCNIPLYELPDPNQKSSAPFFTSAFHGQALDPNLGQDEYPQFATTNTPPQEAFMNSYFHQGELSENSLGVNSQLLYNPMALSQPFHPATQEAILTGLTHQAEFDTLIAD